MTDTPRTREELLTETFANGQTGGITAQDMRDFVVSIPVGEIAEVALQRVASFTAPTSTDWIAFDTVVRDTHGLVVPGSFSSSYGSPVVPANSGVELTEGIWHWYAFLAWSGAKPASGTVVLFADFTEYPSDDVFGNDMGIYAGSHTDFNWSGLAFHNLKTSGTWRITEEMAAAPTRVGLELHDSQAGTVTYCAWYLVRERQT